MIGGYRETNLERLRAGLSQVKRGAYDGVEFKCFNRAEVDELEAALSPADLALVRFTWYTFKGLSAERTGVSHGS